MAFASIDLPAEPPRDPERYRDRIDFTRGLKGDLINGSLFTIIASLALVSALTGPFTTGPLVLKLSCGAIFAYVGLRLFLRFARLKRERVRAFMKGRTRRGTVVSHGRTFVTWKSGRDFTLIVQVTEEDGRVLEKKIRSADRALHETHPLHDEIDLLLDSESGSIFVPAEAGCAATFK
jgi:hypothetical protein